MSLNLQNVSFIKSAAKPSDFIQDSRLKIVFAGKSNVGKSSTINSLLGRKAFAKVSSTPGKTAQVNYFLIDNSVYLVDLPGYGFAKVPQAERDRWASLIENFFKQLEKGKTVGVLITDLRHKPTELDISMADAYRTYEIPFLVIANKCDLVKKSEISANMQRIAKDLKIDPENLIMYSAEKNIGKNEMLKDLFHYINK